MQGFSHLPYLDHFRHRRGKHKEKMTEELWSQWKGKPGTTPLAYLFAAVKFQCLERKSPSTEDRKGEMY